MRVIGRFRGSAHQKSTQRFRDFADNQSESCWFVFISGESTMPAYDNIRIFEAENIYFVTNRCISAMFLMRPGKAEEVQRICLGCLAWAAKKHDIEIFAYVFMSNHFHLLVRALKNNLSEFMRDFQRELAARLNRHWGRTGTVFPRPFDAPVILDDETFLEKLRYIVNNPCLSGLVRHPADWPGISSWHTHKTGEAQVGRFIDYKELRRLRRKDHTAPREGAMRHDELELAKPPMWKDKTDEEVRERLCAAIEEQAAELQKERARRREKVVGPRRVMSFPHDHIPAHPKCSPRVKCLGKDPERITAYLEDRRATVDAYKQAMGKWRNGKIRATFPTGTFPPGRCRCIGGDSNGAIERSAA
jgi:putative transposase